MTAVHDERWLADLFQPIDDAVLAALLAQEVADGLHPSYEDEEAIGE